MKSVSVIVVAAIFSVAAADIYSSLNNFDIHTVLDSDRALMGYVRCLLHGRPCTSIARDFKEAMPEVIQTSCGKCSPKQKHQIRLVINTVIKRHPNEWNQLVNKYDPKRQHEAAFRRFLAEN